MPTRAIARRSTIVGPASDRVAPIYVDKDDNKLKLIPAGSGTTEVEVADSSTNQTLGGTKTFSGQIVQSGAAAPLGYTTGAGGAVTQITSSATAVTLNKPTGQITTVALTTAAAAEERFTVNNSLVVATDTIVLSTTYDGAGTPMLSVQRVAAGAFDIVITNVHAANALNALMVINFTVIKGVAA